jgi:hypothetical protein
MDFIKLIFGKDSSSIIASVLGYIASALVAYLSTVLPGVTGATTLSQAIMIGLAGVVALLGRMINTSAV